MKLDFELIEEELNKIDDVKGKIKFLEKLIFKTKDKKAKEKLIKMLKEIEHLEKKRLSFEKIHEEEEEESQIEKIVMQRAAPPEIHLEELKEYFVELPSEITEIPISIEEEIKSSAYMEKEEYRKISQPTYIPLESETTYQRIQTAIPIEAEIQGGIDVSKPFVNIDFEATKPDETPEELTVEYKREEYLTKFIEREKKEKEEYLRRTLMGV
ncbi:MAG: hypothetical protein J7K22_01050 [Nanoarchaeota archaeon]|nr:hypothetical protein [Nanoarchaeota archaeon]